MAEALPPVTQLPHVPPHRRDGDRVFGQAKLQIGLEQRSVPSVGRITQLEGRLCQRTFGQSGQFLAPLERTPLPKLLLQVRRVALGSKPLAPAIDAAAVHAQ